MEISINTLYNALMMKYDDYDEWRRSSNKEVTFSPNEIKITIPCNILTFVFCGTTTLLVILSSSKTSFVAIKNSWC